MTPLAVTDPPASFDVEAFLRRERGRVNAALAGLASAHTRSAPAALRARVDALAP